jgi:hypothetical protein
MGSKLDTVPSACRMDRTPRSTTTPAKRTTPAAGATTSSPIDAGRSMPRWPAAYSSTGRSNARLTWPRPTGHTHRAATGAAAGLVAGGVGGDAAGAPTGSADADQSGCAAMTANPKAKMETQINTPDIPPRMSGPRLRAVSRAPGPKARVSRRMLGQRAASPSSAEDRGISRCLVTPTLRAIRSDGHGHDRAPTGRFVDAYTSPTGTARAVAPEPEGMRGRAYTCWAMLTSLAARATVQLPAPRSVDDFRSQRFGRNGCQPAPTRPE